MKVTYDPMPQASLLLLGAGPFPGVCTAGEEGAGLFKALGAQGSEEGSANRWESSGL